MFSSVVNTRRKVQKKLNNLTNTRRIQGPPSPASFESPEIVDINEKSSFHSIAHDVSERRNDSQSSLPNRLPSPRLDFPRESISDWFPADLLKGSSISVPQRNVSLPGGSGTTSADVSTVPSRSGSGNEDPTELSQDVIVIEPLQQEVQHREFFEEDSPDPSSARGYSPSNGLRRPTPAPINIPENVFRGNVKAQQSGSSKEVSAGANLKWPPESGENGLSPSRPASTYTDEDSAVSGTTLARELVARSFILPNTEPRNSRYRSSGITRQDSATLPRGEHPFLNSPYWRDKRISNTGEIVKSPDALDSPIPPVPPMPTGMPLGSGGLGSSRQHSPDRTGDYQRVAAGSSGANDGSHLAPSSAEGGWRERRISRISEVTSLDPSAPSTPARGDSSASQSNQSLPISLSSRNANDRNSKEAELVRSQTQDSELHRQSMGSVADIDQILSNEYTDSPPLESAAILAEQPFSASTGSAYSTTTFETRSYTSSGTVTSPDPATSIGSPGSLRSLPESGVVRNNRPALLPIGPGLSFDQVPQSSDDVSLRRSQDGVNPHSFRPTGVPTTARWPGDTPVDSPDLLDFMFPVTRHRDVPAPLLVRTGSHPPPISVPSIEDLISPPSDSNVDPAPSASFQTFPETPYAFTPLVSAGFSHQYPGRKSQERSPMSRAFTFRKPRTPLPRPPLTRSASTGATSPSSRAPEGTDTDNPVPSTSVFPPHSAALSAIEEGSMPSTPQTGIISPAPSSAQRSVSAPTSATPESAEAKASPQPQPEPSPRQQIETSDATSAAAPASLIPAKRTLTPVPPVPSPTPSVPLPGSPLRTSSSVSDSPVAKRTALPPSPAESARTETSSHSSPRANAAPESTLQQRVSARVRPLPPSGPRRPSAVGVVGRTAGRSRSDSTRSIPAHNASRASVVSSATGPKFQTNPVKFRGLTMEAAQWTFTSGQLQEIVSKAIKQSADASVIRLLPLDTLNEALPAEISRLEALSAELRTNYKLAVRKRRMLLGTLSSIAEGSEIADQAAAAARNIEELADVGDHLDRIAEDLHSVTDQLNQLTHLRDTHSSSALAMALRKLNASLVRNMGDNQKLREHIASLEAERDEGWKQAQDVAQELDDMQEKMAESGSQTPGSCKDGASRRSSRVLMARKSSMRASKAGLRSPSRHRSVNRSERSSTSVSLRGSMVGSPALRSSAGVPPVPPIPQRTPLGIVTSDLQQGLMGSETTPTSELRAMDEAQKELCEMLGISVDDLQGGSVPKRRSMSAAVISPTSATATPVTSPMMAALSPAPGRRRRNSEILPVSQRVSGIEDRAAVLALVGMTPREH